MEIEKTEEHLESTYRKVENAVSWGVDKRVLLTIASSYVSSGRTFDGKRFLEISDSIKKSTKWYSPLRGNIMYVIASLLDQDDSEIEEKLNVLFNKAEALKAAGFKESVHLYLAASLLPDESDLYAEAVKAKDFYDEIKKRHRYLTYHDDYTYAVLLRNNGDPSEQADVMRSYYDDLRAEGFMLGNELQWMSQVLAYGNSSLDRSLPARAAEIRDSFKVLGTKIRTSHFPQLGFVTGFRLNGQQLQQLSEIVKNLESMKLFRWYKDMAFPIAVQLMIRELMNEDQAIDISMAATVEMLMQAQQTAMLAVVSTSVAASSTGGE
ncbi:DUF4003 family protein [Chungangia koreensis]|uniref:DUF4003 family protein n=1 Tax=Chungangia koreensis TaxID=752657 RepID=A0ABV8X764_9LACT